MCPMGWTSAVSLNVDEGSGGTLANLSDVRTGTAGDFNFSVAGLYAWDVDASEGPYIDMTAGKAGWNNGTGASLEYPRGTMVLRFRLNDNSSNVALIGTGKVPSLTNQNYFTFKHDGPNQRTFFDFAFGDEDTILYKPGLLDTASTHTVILTWGEKGWGFWLDGEPCPDNRTTPSGSLIVEATKNITLGGLLTGNANMRMYGFDWLDWQISDVERDLIFADPHLLRRPYAAANYLHDRINPWCCCPKPTGVSWRFAVLDSPPDYNFYVRVNYGTDKTLATKSTTAVHQLGVNDVNPGWFEVTASDLTANTRHYWIAEWSTDGSTWYPFPGGQGTFMPQRTNEAAFEYAKIADSHTGTLGSTLSYGYDIERDGLTYLFWRGWRVMNDVFQQRERYDFILSLGDDSYDARNADGGWCILSNLLKISGCCFHVVGNHEDLSGWKLAVTDAEDSTLKKRSKAWRAWMRNTCNPHKDTYEQGVPWSALPTPPVDDETDYQSNVPWIPDVPAGGGQWAPEGITGPQDFFDTYVYVDPSAGAHVAKMRGLHDPHTNFAFVWGAGRYKTLVIGLDIYSCSVPGSLSHADLRANVNECSLSEETWTWLETIVPASGAKNIDINMHSLPDAGLETGTVWGGSGYYWRGSALTITGTEALRLMDFVEQHGAMLSKGHDHVFAVVKWIDSRVVTVGPSGSAYMFGNSGATQAEEQYGDRNLQGGDLTRLISKWGAWSYCIYAPQGNAVFQVKVRQACVDTTAFVDQDGAIASTDFKMRYIGEELTVTDLTLTLSEPPDDILCMCDTADGTFEPGGDDPNILDDYVAYNDYAHTYDDGDGMPLAADCLQPLAGKLLDVTGTYDNGDKVRVHYAPRMLCEITIRNGEKAEDWSSFGAAPNAYERSALVI